MIDYFETILLPHVLLTGSESDGGPVVGHSASGRCRVERSDVRPLPPRRRLAVAWLAFKAVIRWPPVSHSMRQLLDQFHRLHAAFTDDSRASVIAQP